MTRTIRKRLRVAARTAVAIGAVGLVLWVFCNPYDRTGLQARLLGTRAPAHRRANLRYRRLVEARIAELESRIRAGEATADVFADLADEHAALGNYGQARDALHHAFEIDPANKAARKIELRVLYYSALYDEMELKLEEYSRLFPGDGGPGFDAQLLYEHKGSKTHVALAREYFGSGLNSGAGHPSWFQYCATRGYPLHVPLDTDAPPQEDGGQ